VCCYSSYELGGVGHDEVNSGSAWCFSNDGPNCVGSVRDIRLYMFVKRNHMVRVASVVVNAWLKLACLA
jgi:hypothetical protein